MADGPGGGSANIEYTAVKTVTEDTAFTGETIESTGDDENALLVKEGANVTFTEGTLVRSSETSSGGDNASFYGVGAAALVTDGELHVNGTTINTDADGGAGVFAYGDGVAYVENATITTKQGASGGIHVAGGGTLYAKDLTVETNGRSSAAIRSDRGGGTGGECSIYISEDSTWTVTGDSVVTDLYNAGKITDASGKSVTVKDTAGNVMVQGESEYTITVESYTETADLSGAGEL